MADGAPYLPVQGYKTCPRTVYSRPTPAIYKPDTQPKPRPHAYTHAYTGTPARPHPRKTHCTHPRTHTTARGPAKSQVMSEKGHQKHPKQPESHPHPLTTAPKPSKSQVMSKRGIKSVRNRPNNTPIRSQPILQHDSGHMRTACLLYTSDAADE